MPAGFTSVSGGSDDPVCVGLDEVDVMRALACCRLVVATTAITANKRMMVADDAICFCIYILLVDKAANNLTRDIRYDVFYRRTRI